MVKLKGNLIENEILIDILKNLEEIKDKLEKVETLEKMSERNNNILEKFNLVLESHLSPDQIRCIEQELNRRTVEPLI